MEKEIIISNRYHVKRKIGEGGMAKVYLAYDQSLDCDVALKILKKENVDEKKVKSFKREARTLSLLDDPNIVSIYDVGEENGIHYIANEFVEGMTLKEYVSTCAPIPVEEVIKITTQILSGLEHAHNKGVVHKDIKSQNILLDSKRNVKITDLGIADIIDEEVTRTQSLMGTPQYVAPEILNRDALTVQSDIYSVGILMYEMLVGKAPFTGDKPAIIMIKQMNHPLPSITEQRSDVPQVLENIAIKASAKKLENRYQNVAQMRDDLQKIEMGHIHEPKLVLENDLMDDKKLEQTIILDTTSITQKFADDKPKKGNKLRIMLLIIILLLTALLILNRLRPEPDIMPDFRNESIEEVQSDELFDIHDFSIIYSYSSEIEENNVISTEPEQGNEIDDEQEIFITVSKGPKEKEIADYIGTKLSVTQNELESLNYVVSVKEVDSLEDSGTIISQSPTAGETIAYGSTIYFEVSKGAIDTTVPNFIGLDYTEAEAWAEENGINLNKDTVCNNTNLTKNAVSNQTPKYKSEISTGDSLSITVLGDDCEVLNVDEDDTKDDSDTTNDTKDDTDTIDNSTDDSDTKDESNDESNTSDDSSNSNESTDETSTQEPDTNTDSSETDTTDNETDSASSSEEQ